MMKMSKKKALQPILIAHRGGIGAGRNNQNTLAAFRSAIDDGCKYLETDVVVSADGKVVIEHGAQNLFMEIKSGLKRRKLVQKQSYRQMQKNHRPGGEDIPLLKDVLTTFGDVYFSVDVKTNESVLPTTKIISQTHSENRVLITSFRLKRSLKAKQALSSSQAGLCIYRVQAIMFSPFLDIVLKWLSKKGITHIYVPYMFTSSRFLRIAHKNRMKVLAWTVNEPKEMKKMIALGVDGIISDDFAKLIEIASSK